MPKYHGYGHDNPGPFSSIDDAAIFFVYYLETYTTLESAGIHAYVNVDEYYWRNSLSKFGWAIHVMNRALPVIYRGG